MSKPIDADPVIDPVNILPDVPLWTGEIGVVTKNSNGGLDAIYSLTDGVKTVNPPTLVNLPNMSAVINTVQKAVDSKNREVLRKAEVEVLDTAAITGPLETVKELVNPKPTPTQEATDRKTFQDLWTQYKIALAAEAAKLPIPITPDSATLKVEVDKKWKPEYGTILIGRF
jgi:hypothetical protein